MQIHEITEGILKGVKAVATPITGTLGTVKNAAKFAGQAVTRPGLDYFADKILSAAGIPNDPIIRGANADQVAAATDAKAAADKAAKDSEKAAERDAAAAKKDHDEMVKNQAATATTNTAPPATTNAPPGFNYNFNYKNAPPGFNYNNVTKLPVVNKPNTAPATTKTAPPTVTNASPGFNYSNVTKLPGVSKPNTAPAPVATPQQSKIGVGQINKIIPTLRTRDLLSVKKNVDNTLAVKQKQPEPAATNATTKPQWTGRPQNLTKQQKDYINAIQRNAK